MVIIHAHFITLLQWFRSVVYRNFNITCGIREVVIKTMICFFYVIRFASVTFHTLWYEIQIRGTDFFKNFTDTLTLLYHFNEIQGIFLVTV